MQKKSRAGDERLKASSLINMKNRLMTWNVMGTTTILDELWTLTQEDKPCIIVLTETRITELEQDRKTLNTCLPDYRL